jgi:hypothetical protein
MALIAAHARRPIGLLSRAAPSISVKGSSMIGTGCSTDPTALAAAAATPTPTPARSVPAVLSALV